MVQNKIKIKSDLKTNTLAFYILNEKQKWCPVSNSSALSRKKFVNANIKEISEDIIYIIDSVYNIHNRGVEIRFEGSYEEFTILYNVVNTLFADKNIKCVLQQTIIAVAGKIGVGKTTLINELVHFKGNHYQTKDIDGIITYSNDSNTIMFYEIPGIDIGIENVIAAQKTFQQLVRTGITTFIYCLGTYKVESLEKDLIDFVAENYPSVKIIIALTKHIYENESEYLEQLSKCFNGIYVLPLLAKDLNIRQGTIKAYGIDTLDQVIFG